MRPGDTIHIRRNPEDHIAIVWTPDEEQLVLNLWHAVDETGNWLHSASQIAAYFPGRTKNGIIGKLRRLGAPGRKSPIKILEPGQPRAQRRKPKSPNPAIYRREATKDPTLPPLRAVRAPREKVPEKVVSTFYGAAETCQFPVGDQRPYTLCGAGRHGTGPYCLAHARICFRQTAEVSDAA